MSDHKVLWHHDMDTIVGEIICTADPESGALCRLDCENPACFEGAVGPVERVDGQWVHAYGDDELHPLKKTGYCNFREWMDCSSSIIESYGGPETEVRSGPIDVTWNGDNFEWTYVGVGGS